MTYHTTKTRDGTASNPPMCAIIDTCVLLSDPNFLVRAEEKKGAAYPVITDIVVREIDYNKKNSDPLTAKSARLILKKINQTHEKMNSLPCGKTLKDGDTICKYNLGITHVSRRDFRNRA